MTEPNLQPKPTLVPLKIENLDEARKRSGLNGVGYYLKATREILPTLQHMVDTATSFDELKKELTALIQDRQELIEFEKNNPPQPGQFPR